MSAVPPAVGWRSALGARASALSGSRFARNALMLTLVSGLERIAALVQTVLVARALGIVEYGVYGLLFTSIGFVASVAGLQMGLTATVLVARFRAEAPARAAAVIGFAMRFAWLVGMALLVCVLPFSEALSTWLLRSPDHTLEIALGAAFVAFSLASGVQDGVVQGFEDFATVARVRLLTGLATLLAIYPAAIAGGLSGVLLATLGGLGLRYALLARAIATHRRNDGLPREGSGMSFREMVFGFSLPSMLASMLLGGVLWFGSLLLSRQHQGFESIAMVNTGLQWRGPILMLAASLGAVAIPAFSRHAGADDVASSGLLRQRLLRANGLVALCGAVLLGLLARPLLAMYGPGFGSGAALFTVIVASTVPAVMANVYMQELVGHGRLWRQLWLHVPMTLVLLAGFAWSIPRWQGTGYARTLALGTTVFMVNAWLAYRLDAARGRYAVATGER
jgi:O-antigen/teichoic acid export membrane protein